MYLYFTHTFGHSTGQGKPAVPGRPIPNRFQIRRKQTVRACRLTAFRSHRERKANYLKALEQEIVSLRNQNSQNIQEYEDEVRMLQGILLSAGISLPPRQARVIAPTTAEVDPANPSSFTVSKHSGLGQALYLHVPDTMSKDSYASTGSSGHLLSDSELSSHSGSMSNQRHLLPSNISTGPRQAGLLGIAVSEQYSPVALDKVHGVNFVLAYVGSSSHGYQLLTR